jgi:hypothetical protein
MLRDILLHSREVLHVKKMLLEMIKQNKVANCNSYRARGQQEGLQCNGEAV